MSVKAALVGLLATLFLLPKANATPGATAGAIAGGTAGAIICDHVVRSYMEATPESDEEWYLVWHHVGPEDLAGFAAGTVCAIPGAALGAAAGAAAEATVVGVSVTAAGTVVVIVVGKGLQVASRAAGPTRQTRVGARWEAHATREAVVRTGQVRSGGTVDQAPDGAHGASLRDAEGHGRSVQGAAAAPLRRPRRGSVG